ncbi:MAG TPA: bacterial transcriptional activator domain-containing protein [Ilumatobacteraceae bacterium]|nr:bacterial transcriptional activator domain-containing protein [Ilumatobacteraceae bacterium]
MRVDLADRDRWAERLRAGEPGTGDLDVEVSGLADELLPDWCDDWVLMERERFRQRTLHASEKLMQALAAAGRYDEAIDVAYSAVILEPLRESTHRALVLAHLAEGNRGEAVRHIDRCRALFLQELGYDVGPDLLELLEPCSVA